jgi:hypothetical protein
MKGRLVRSFARRPIRFAGSSAPGPLAFVPGRGARHDRVAAEYANKIDH